MNITVLGAGAWGTALAKLLSENGNAIALWGHDAQRLEELRCTSRNEHYLSGIALPQNWRIEPDLPRAIADSECIVAAIPSKAFREVTAQLSGFNGTIVSVTKGIEPETGLTMSGI